MRTLARYAETNVVVRTMRSSLLTKNEFDALHQSSSIQDAWAILQNTAFGTTLTNAPSENPLVRECQIRAGSRSQFKRLIRRLHGRAAIVGALLLSRWELDNLEFALRTWHGRDSGLGRDGPIPAFTDPIPYELIRQAENLDEIIIALKATPYSGPIAASAAVYHDKRSIFFIEISLEKDYYSRLLAATRALGGADAREGIAAIGAEIDLVNLSWITRILSNSQLQNVNAAEALIPGPANFSRHVAAKDLSKAALVDLADLYLQKFLPGQRDAISDLERISMLDYAITETAIAEARRQFSRYPFQIASVYAVYILIRIEMKNLCSVFAGKSGME